MIHIAMTGPWAGENLCGKTNVAIHDDGERSAHVPYTDAETFLARADICPECLHVWRSADDETAKEKEKEKESTT